MCTLLCNGEACYRLPSWCRPGKSHVWAILLSVVSLTARDIDTHIFRYWWSQQDTENLLSIASFSLVFVFHSSSESNCVLFFSKFLPDLNQASALISVLLKSIFRFVNYLCVQNLKNIFFSHRIFRDICFKMIWKIANLICERGLRTFTNYIHRKSMTGLIWP